MVKFTKLLSKEFGIFLLKNYAKLGLIKFLIIPTFSDIHQKILE